MSDQEPRPSRVVPVLVAALVCDTAATDPTSGKKTLIGIFDRLFAQSFPTGRPMTLYWKLTDAEGFYNVKARFVQLKTGTVLGEALGNLSVPDRMLAYDFYLSMPMLPFPEAGRYELQIVMNEAYLGGAVIDANATPKRSESE